VAFFSLNQNQISMKKLVLLLISIFTLSLYSCRETTQEKTEDAVEAIGKDIEDNVNKAGEKVKEGAKKVEEGAEKVEREIDEEIHEDDN
jgi:gas vesicle protein|tara:strand:+ start:491 stop:757 length:267 start_codon:yes stop_codon:yes gene_type:complete